MEKFFKLHDYITVDEMGNVVLGDDIIGKFVGNTAKGSFTINTSNPFVEKTVEQFCTIFNQANTSDLLYQMYNLLNGTIDHNINCQYTITRPSADSKAYTISFVGEGTYKLNAEVVDRIENFNFDNYPGLEQTLTPDDITTRQVEAEGTVRLTYDTKL